MNVVSKVEAAVGRLSVAWLSLAVRYPMAYLVMTAFIGVVVSDCFLCAGSERAAGNAGHDRAKSARAPVGGSDCQGTCSHRIVCLCRLALCRALDGCCVVSGRGGHSWAPCQHCHGNISGFDREHFYSGIGSISCGGFHVASTSRLN